MLQYERNVLARLPLSVPWDEVVPDNAREAKGLRLGGQRRSEVVGANQTEIHDRPTRVAPQLEQWPNEPRGVAANATNFANKFLIWLAAAQVFHLNRTVRSGRRPTAYAAIILIV